MSDQSQQKGGGLWARLWGAAQEEGKAGATATQPVGEILPSFDDPASAVPVATPVGQVANANEFPVAAVVAAPLSTGVPAAEPVETAAVAPERCPACGAVRANKSEYCFDCGMLFPEGKTVVDHVSTTVAVAMSVAPAVPSAAPVEPAVAAVPPTPVVSAGTGKRIGGGGRYEVGQLVQTRGNTDRHQGMDHGVGGQPIIILSTPVSDQAEANEEILVGAMGDTSAEWPSLAWEVGLLQRVNHPCVPSVLDRFTEDGVEYAVIEQPVGQLLWDANDDPAYPAWVRFGWMAELAEGLKALHDAGGIVEGLRPDILVLNEAGHLVFNDLTGLLSLPLPANPMVAGNLYTAPEMIIDPASADGRADLYSFGAMLYALYIGRELTEMDFEKPYVPKPFVFRFPDTNPQLGRIIMKTFVRDPLYRFPTDEASKEDATGMLELAKCLRILGRLMSQVRLEIAGWTNTGKVRTNNEDAFALVHSSSSREESLGDRVLLVLCDGMGGYEAGEVAAAMTIDYVRQTLLKDPLFQGLSNVDPSAVPEFDLGKCHDTLVRTLQEINKHIYTIAKTPGSGRRGMGCTTEVLYIDNERLASAHVGDSRVYHYSNGRLTQLTRDQTLVARLVELGQLSAEEAENHPRKNELQQAMGSQPIVEPLTYHVPLRQGDWILVCSDGLINHVDHNTLTEMLQRSDSAEMAARRLVNLANAYGGSDNTTVVAIRCT